MEVSDRIFITIADMLITIRDHFGEEKKEGEKVDHSAAIGFIGSVKSINLYAMNKEDIKKIITKTFFTPKKQNADEADEQVDSTLKLFMHLKSTVVVRFPDVLMKTLCEMFAESNDVGILFDNDSDKDGVTRYVTKEQLKEIVNKDPSLIVLWLLQLASKEVIRSTFT